MLEGSGDFLRHVLLILRADHTSASGSMGAAACSRETPSSKFIACMWICMQHCIIIDWSTVQQINQNTKRRRMKIINGII